MFGGEIISSFRTKYKSVWWTNNLIVAKILQFSRPNNFKLDPQEKQYFCTFQQDLRSFYYFLMLKINELLVLFDLFISQLKVFCSFYHFPMLKIDGLLVLFDLFISQLKDNLSMISIWWVPTDTEKHDITFLSAFDNFVWQHELGNLHIL